MQHLEVSCAVRPIRWPLGVKWLIKFEFSKKFRKIPQNQLSWIVVQWEPSCSVRIDWQTYGRKGRTKLIFTFESFANVLNNLYLCRRKAPNRPMKTAVTYKIPQGWQSNLRMRVKFLSLTAVTALWNVLHLAREIFPTAELLKIQDSSYVMACQRLKLDRHGEESSCLHLPGQAVQADCTWCLQVQD